MKEENCGGEYMEIHYDENIDKLDLNLVKRDGYYEIWFEDMKTEKVLFKLHIKEAIELKSLIDKFVFEAASGEHGGE